MPPAREPKNLRNAQGFTRSSYWPTPDQPRSAPCPAVNCPAAVLMPLTEKPWVSPAFSAYRCV